MTTIQDRRRDAENNVSRLTAQREATIASLIRCDGRLRDAQRKLERIKRATTKLLAQQTREIIVAQATKPVVADVTDIPVTELPIADDLAIPPFLRRTKEADARDKAVADQIRAEQAERKTVKARGRIAKMKAVQSGDTRRMPLTGRAALDAIRKG